MKLVIFHKFYHGSTVTTAINRNDIHRVEESNRNDWNLDSVVENED